MVGNGNYGLRPPLRPVLFFPLQSHLSGQQAVGSLRYYFPAFFRVIDDHIINTNICRIFSVVVETPRTIEASPTNLPTTPSKPLPPALHPAILLPSDAVAV